MNYAKGIRYAILTAAITLPKGTVFSGRFMMTAHLATENWKLLLTCILTP